MMEEKLDDRVIIPEYIMKMTKAERRLRRKSSGFWKERRKQAENQTQHTSTFKLNVLFALKEKVYYTNKYWGRGQCYKRIAKPCKRRKIA